MEEMYTNEIVYMLGFDEDKKSVVLDTFLLRKYVFENELNSFLSENPDDIEAIKLRRCGFSDIVDEIPVFKGNNFNIKNDPKIADNSFINKCDIQDRLLHLRIYDTIRNCFDKYQLKFENLDVAVRQQEKMNSQLNLYYDLISTVREKFCDSDMLEIIEDYSFEKIMQLTSVICLDGRAYCNISVRLIGGCAGIKRINAKYDIVKKNLEVLSCTGLMYYEYGKNTYDHGLLKEEAMCKMFSLPMNSDYVVERIRKKVKEIVYKEIKSDDICYDWARDCYYLNDKIERTLFPEFVVEESTEVKLAKYCSLSTLLKTLGTGKMRLNSIVSMNDRTEVDYLSEYTRNFNETVEVNDDKYFFADKKFITSFTVSIDDLNMWRFYGDDAQGVCMVFKKVNKKSIVKKVRYIDEANGVLSKIQKLNHELAKENIKFRFRILDNNSLFVKPRDFEIEKEHRLFISSKEPHGWYSTGNSIITPYLELNLFERNGDESDYPFVLKEIILGPEMPHRDINRCQIKNLLMSRWWDISTISDIKVSISSISSYRR